MTRGSAYEHTHVAYERHGKTSRYELARCKLTISLGSFLRGQVLVHETDKSTCTASSAAAEKWTPILQCTVPSLASRLTQLPKATSQPVSPARKPCKNKQAKQRMLNLLLVKPWPLFFPITQNERLNHEFYYHDLLPGPSGSVLLATLQQLEPAQPHPRTASCRAQRLLASVVSTSGRTSRETDRVA